MSENIRAIPFIVVAVSLGVVGQVLMKHGMNQYRLNPPPGASGQFIKDLRYIFLNLWVLSGFASYGISTIIWLYVLTRAELSFAYPFISISYIAVILIGPWLFREAIDIWKVLAIVLIILGVFSMTISERVSERAKGPQAQPVAAIHQMSASGAEYFNDVKAGK
jgi:multidrug transporter EmrE-like cation transporter